jgi:hypothetical protein
MAMLVHEKALSIIEALASIMPLIQRQDRALGLQLRTAASSMVLKIAEAEYSDPGNRALGSSPPRALPTSRGQRFAWPSRGATSGRSAQPTCSVFLTKSSPSSGG